MRGPEAWTGADPAFGAAAGVLFRRLVLNPVFTARFGPRDRSRWLEDLRYQEAITPRKHWARLRIALLGAEGVMRDVTRIWSRAAGDSPPSEAEDWLFDPDPAGAELLRGEVLGGLLEDDLMTRFGRGWFEKRAAGSYLQELWEADPDETAESMASSLGLGTIEPAPIMDLFRP